MNLSSHSESMGLNVMSALPLQLHQLPFSWEGFPRGLGTCSWESLGHSLRCAFVRTDTDVGLGLQSLLYQVEIRTLQLVSSITSSLMSLWTKLYWNWNPQTDPTKLGAWNCVVWWSIKSCFQWKKELNSSNSSYFYSPSYKLYDW